MLRSSAILPATPMRPIFDADRQVQYQLSRRSEASALPTRASRQIASQIETEVPRFRNKACCLLAPTMPSVVP